MTYVLDIATISLCPCPSVLFTICIYMKLDLGVGGGNGNGNVDPSIFLHNIYWSARNIFFSTSSKLKQSSHIDRAEEAR